jgi:hypothetical protein
MAWRDSFLKLFGTGLLGGATLGDWLRVLRENRFAVAPSCWLRACAITTHSFQNSFFRRVENLRFGSRVRETPIQPPLFLLGHWRQGTTHLHNLVTVDDRFAFPNNYQVFFPHAFLTTEALSARAIGFFLPKRRPMDNIEWNMRSPQEDEFALGVTSLMSPYFGWMFSRRREHYDRYLTFRDVPEAEIKRWKEAFVWFLKKLSWKYKRPLVLKSPTHTCRIRLLLEMFPDAKFVHIHRNPYAVFPSSKRTLQVCFQMNRLQDPRLNELDDQVFLTYRELHDVFFAERNLIPKERFHEMSFEKLEEDPIGEMKRMYRALSLPDFSHVEPALRKYVDSIAGYKKNEFPDLSEDLRERIATEWRRCFDEWGYAV